MALDSREADLQEMFKEKEYIPCVDLDEGSIWWFNPDKNVNPLSSPFNS